jgi:hypothetical protein
VSTLTTETIVANIVAKLGITAPGLSLEIGTPERKIIEAAAEAIFESQVDNNLVSTQLDIDTKSGADLEDFVGVFSFGRLQGQYATGSITFTLNIPAVQPILIAYGTQVFKPGSFNTPNITYTTTASATLDVGQKVITVPAQAALIGTSGNAPSGTITGFPAGLGISTCTNIDPFSNGKDDETDDELRTRFKNTFLRNIAGTADFYTALATQAQSVKRVKILGPINTFDCQVQTGAAATPVTLPSKNCKYVWPMGYAVSENRGSTDQTWFTDTVDYNVTSGPVTAPVLIPATPTANKFLDVSYEYTSSNSRNDPLKGVANKVDMYVDGAAPVQVTEKLYTKAITMSTDPNSVNWTGNFVSYPAGRTLTGSTKYQRLGSTPILTWPSSISVGSTVYTLGTNYYGLRDATLNKGSEREVAGIGWITTPPADGLSTFVTYTYNQIPEVLNSILRKSKQITSDPLVHSAYQKFLSMYFIVQYDLGTNPSEIAPRVQSALSTYLSSLSFGAWIQFSDLTTFVHNIQGVDNCRMAKLSDGVPYIVSEMENGVSTGVTYVSDFQIGDNEVPVLDSVNLVRRSFNNFG